MRSITDYRSIFRNIASNLGLQGESVELLVQLLAQATYIGEVENIEYLRESSIDSAVLINSKIQHCVDSMYSVYRGNCPRVVMNIVPNKFYSFNPYDILVESNNFKVYYLGYWKEGEDMTVDAEGISKVPLESGFKYGPISIPPTTDGTPVTLIGFIASNVIEKTWKPSGGRFYLECLEDDLSEDMYVMIGPEGSRKSIRPVTRIFEEHILRDMIFDLTIPSFGSRLYFPDVDEIVNQVVEAKYFKKSSLSDYNINELKKISLVGSDLAPFNESWISLRNFDEEVVPGLLLVDSTPADTLETIHYKASKDRYVGSIMRSNSDIGTVLEELYPRKVISGGTTYEIIAGSAGSIIYIYYIPTNENNLLTRAEIGEFENEKKIYYITDNISVKKGYLSRVNFSIDVDLYSSDSIDSEIAGILKAYENKFGLDFSSKELIDEITLLIGKLSNVKRINNISISTNPEPADISKTYYKISYSINTKLSSK